jgi:hypothetical protein
MAIIDLAQCINQVGHRLPDGWVGRMIAEGTEEDAWIVWKRAVGLRRDIWPDIELSHRQF